MSDHTFETALVLGDFEVALPLLEDMTSEEQSHLTLPHDLTPLHYACQHGRVDVAKLLLNNYKYSIERRDINGCTPLHTAAQYGQLEVFKYLLQILFTNGGTHLQLRVDGKLCHTLMSVYQQTLSERHRDLSGNTPLHTASKHGSVDIVQLLIQDIGSDPQDRNMNDMSCLDLAAQYGHVPLVKYLATQHCDLFGKGSTTSLLFATESGHLGVVRFFIKEFQCGANSKDTQEVTLLHHASKHGHLNIVKYLVETMKCVPLCPDIRLDTPLHIAAYFGHLEVVKYFTIDQHCDPLVKNAYNNTPLHLAALKGRLDVVKFLIENLKCDPNSRGELKRIPLHLASKGGHLNIIHYLIGTNECDLGCPDETGNTPLHVAALFGHLEVVKYFTIDQHCDPLVKNVDNNTPLHLAALEGRLDVVKFLIENLKCDPNSRGEFKRIPLHFACQGGHLNTVKLLAGTQKCDLMCPDENDNTPLHVAASYGPLEIVKHLTIDQHCDPLVKNADNNTPLHLAALEGRLDVLKFFIEDIKCDPNSRGKLKRAPLHFVSQGGFLNIIKYLVETQNCDPLCCDEKAFTPLHVATVHNMFEAVVYYTTHLNIDPLVQDINNNTPLHLAALHGNENIIYFFIDVLKCNLNCEGQSKRTPLHLAIEYGNSNVSRFLANHKPCNMLSLDSQGVTPLLLAVKKGNHEIVQQMMHTHRIDPYTQPDKRALLSAAKDSGMLEYFANYVDPLHQAAINGDMDTVRHYIERVQWSPLVKDRHGNNLLHTAVKYGQLEVIKYLTGFNREHSLCALTVDPNIKNKDGLTAQQLASNKDMHVVSYLRQASDNQPTVKHLALPPSVNILVMGNSGSGKSTLIKALSQVKSIFGRFVQVKGVQSLTAGIIPTTISNQDFGKVNIYDFAGHEEYYASHEMILHQTTQPLVLIAVNISLSMADIEKQLCYWLSILSNAKNDHAMHVLVIGSHADKTSNACIQEVEQKVSLLAGNEGGIIYHGFVHCDCRYSVSNGMSQLHHMLSEVCMSIRLSLSYSDTSFSNRMCASLMYYLDCCSPDDKAASMTINQLQQQIKSIESPSPNLERLTEREVLVQTCNNLSTNGHLIFLSHYTDVGKSLLLTDEKTILSKVHACLGRIDQSINSLGILEEQQLKAILSSSLKDTMEPNLAVNYLLIAQFCTEVTPDQLTSVPHGVNEQATHYFFPNLVLAERPAQLWTSAEEDKYTHLYTWCLRCSNARHFFTPRYLHTLFIQLIKCDSTGNAKYTIWKNGILFVHRNGTRCVIEVVQTTQLFVAIQCVEGCELKLVKQRSFLISLIRSLISKICSKLEVDEFLLHPQNSYPPTVTTEIPISAIASSVALGHEFVVAGDGNSHQHVSVSSLLYFDPLHKIRISILQDIFINCHSEKYVPHSVMRKVCAAVEICEELVKRFHNDSVSGIKEITYQQLYEDLMEFSIFRDEHIQNILAQNDTYEMEEEQDTITQSELSHSIFNNPLELVDLYEVNVQLVSVTKWKEFGLVLGISRATLEKIRANFQSIEQCLTEVLAALLKGQDRPHNSPLNWREVIETLNSPKLNMRDCAKILVQKLMKDKDKENGVVTARGDTSPVDDSVLDSHSLMDVKMSLFSLKHKWFHLGLSLGLSYYTLKIIEQSPSEDCLTEVLVKWLDQADMTLTRGPPSWRSLAAVLDCPLVQEHDVARNIKKDHPTNLISL